MLRPLLHACMRYKKAQHEEGVRQLTLTYAQLGQQWVHQNTKDYNRRMVQQERVPLDAETRDGEMARWPTPPILATATAYVA